MTPRPQHAVAEPAAPPPRQQMDWSSRARTTAQESQRYTRFVGFMRRTLLIAGLSVLAIVLAYSLMPRHQTGTMMTVKNLGILNNDLAMEKPRLTGFDNDGNPYVVTATRAVQDSHNTRRAHLFKLSADLTQKKDGTWINLNAPTGMLDGNAHTLKLDGPIDTFSDNGYEIHTMAADVDLQKGIVKGNRMIVGQGPLGNMRADSFWLNRITHVVVLNGNVHMTIYPAAMKKEPKKS